MAMTAIHASLANPWRSPGLVVPIGSGSVGAPPGIATWKAAYSSLITPPDTR